MKKEYDFLIVGAGLFGAVFAQQAKEHGFRVLVIDKRSHIAGNVYCKNENGIDIHMYGAHIFHTDNEKVWSYVHRFTKMNRYTNSPLAFYKNELYNLPFNMNTFHQLWGIRTPAEAKARIEEQQSKYKHIQNPTNLEEQALRLCGEDIYYAFIKEYTEKQWGRDAKELPAFIIKRIPFRYVYDNNYFNDPYQGIPENGYTTMVEEMLKGVEVRCNTNYFEDRANWDSIANRILYTGCIDKFFNYEFGALEYRSLRFEHEYLETNNYQGNAVINYTEAFYPFTRIIEHKHFLFGQQPFTIITKEYPKAHEKDDEPYYPVNDNRNSALYNRYKEKADHHSPHILFGGRLAQYAYFDMDDTIAAALSLFEQSNQ